MSLKGDSSSAVAVGGLFLSRSSLCKKGRAEGAAEAVESSSFVRPLHGYGALPTSSRTALHQGYS